MPQQYFLRSSARLTDGLRYPAVAVDETDEGDDPEYWDEGVDIERQVREAIARLCRASNAGARHVKMVPTRPGPLPTAAQLTKMVSGRKIKKADRLARYINSRVSQRLQLQSEVSSRTLVRGSPYIGFRAVGEGPDARIVVPMGHGVGAEVYDGDGRLVVLRAWSPEGPRWGTINGALQRGAEILAAVPPTFKGGKRGDFQAYYFGLHRGSQVTPMMSSFTTKNGELFKQVKTAIEPVRQRVQGIFATNFPDLHARYCAAMDYINDALPGVGAAFYPFACFAFNLGDVMCRPHKDFLNFITGVCLIIPFGDFDHTTSCRLVVQELGLEFEVAAGIPIIIPSAMYTHYNNLLNRMGVRQSFTAWTGGPVIQWVDLKGRAVNELTREEEQEYRDSLTTRIARGLALFPVRDDMSTE
ncbi:hypothetical protein FA95DRAFT_1608994 [Auriscalpium vulgare]|uniref:Uncharacterized protein n=1 Tax=Auriscalpium vulgare TaxID=40419 RepID=A0ACB8RIG9_9AGAM|nr:hypothetical protein FA95DRAFT_1608994 [Auriscalpium vulgare]